MATATLNPIISSISGSVGSLVFYERYGKTIMRTYIIPPNPNTPAQSKNRDRFRQAMASWQGLSSHEKALYNKKACMLGMTGHNLYISRYMKQNGCNDSASCTGNQKHMEMPAVSGTGPTQVVPPLGRCTEQVEVVRGIDHMKVDAARDMKKGGCGDTFIPHVALSNGFALSNRIQEDVASGRNIAQGSQTAGKIAPVMGFALSNRFTLSNKLNTGDRFALSNEVALSGYFALSKPPSPIYEAYPSVTAPSIQAMRIFTHRITDNPPAG